MNNKKIGIKMSYEEFCEMLEMLDEYINSEEDEMIRHDIQSVLTDLIHYGTIIDDTFIHSLNIRITIIKDDVTGRYFKTVRKDGEAIQVQRLTEQYTVIEM